MKKEAARFFVEEPLESLKENALLSLSQDESAHLSRVMRKREGDEVCVFDGLGFEGRAQVIEIGKREVQIELLDKKSAPCCPRLNIHLAVALPRGGAADDLVKRCIEAGVASVTPIQTQRSVQKAERKTWDKQLDRFRRMSISALKQCGRNLFPQLHPPRNISDLAGLLSPDQDGFYGATAAGQKTLQQMIAQGRDFKPDVWVVIGPEGGLEAEEERWLESEGFEPAGLGPQVLRIENAALVFVGILAGL